MPVLLLAVLGILWHLLFNNRAHLGLSALSIRGAFVVAFVLFEALLVFITETTSAVHKFTTTGIAMSWGLVLLLLLVLEWSWLRRATQRRAPGDDHRWRFPRPRVEECAWVGVVVLIVATLALIGWMYPPNNNDSMAYHLPRVEHWIQNRSVEHFATHVLAQLELGPLAEYNVAQVDLLSGMDWLDGYVQLVAFVVCAVAASEIARLLGAGRWAQLAATVVAITIPSAILQATSTQNNLFAAAIGISLLLIVMQWSVGRGWAQRAVAIGVATGLAVIAKGTLPYLLGPPCVALVLFGGFREAAANRAGGVLGRTAASGVIALVCAALIAGPFLSRNIQLFGGPIGPVSQSTISTSLGPGPAAANVLRSTAGNFMIGDGKGGLETWVSRGALGLLRGLYAPFHVSVTDRRYELGDYAALPFTVQDYSALTRFEDVGANPWHVLLIGVAAVILLLGMVRERRQFVMPLLLAIGLATGYVLFSSTAKWTPYNIRYQLPSLVAWCPVIAVALGSLHWILGRLVLAALVVACLPQLTDNLTRSLLHADFPYSATLEPYHATSLDLTGTIAESSCSQVGLATLVELEYPIWAGLHQHGWRGTLENVGVENVSGRLERRDFHPCAAISEVTPDYVTPDDGRVHLQFQNLALAVDASRAGTIGDHHSFSSNLGGVHVLPGSGWVLQAADRPSLVDAGTLYVLSDRACTLRLQVDKGTAQDGLSLMLLDPALHRIPATGSARELTFDVSVPGGVSRLHVQVASASNSGGSLRLAIDGMKVVDCG